MLAALEVRLSTSYVLCPYSVTSLNLWPCHSALTTDLGRSVVSRHTCRHFSVTHLIKTSGFIGCSRKRASIKVPLIVKADDLPLHLCFTRAASDFDHIVQVWLCEPLAFLLPHNIWFKAHFLITVLNTGNYSLRLRTLLSFFMDSLRCSNLWWLSGMSFLPLILSPHSFPICLSLRSCPQTSTGRLKEFGGFLFFFLMQSRCRGFILIMRDFLL